MAYDTLVVTPYGYRFIGDIKVNDKVYTRNGNETSVTEIPFEGTEESYRVVFEDGTEVTASAGHKWLVGTGDWGKTNNPLRVKTTEELLDFKLPRNRNKYFVPTTKPVDFNQKKIPLDPYFLGLMLGDGCITKRSNMTLTSVDPELLDYIKLPKGYSPKKVKGGIQWKFTQGQYGGTKDKSSVIWDAFKSLGLAGKNSFTKFIPQSYLLNTVETRVAVLQGMMDTDGTVRESGSRKGAELKYTTVSKDLKKGFVFLAQSLGFKVKVSKEHLKTGSIAYRIYLSGSDICPFRLTRKVSRWKKAFVSKPVKYITSVEPVGQVDVKCITVEDQDHTFLIDSFTVTMNSAGGGKSYAMVADPVRYLNNPKANMLLVRRSTEELRELVSVSKQLYPRAIPGIKFSERDKTWTTPNGAQLWMSYLDRDDDVSRYQGQAFNWIGFDELTQWPTSYAWDYMRSRLRTAKGSGLPLNQRATSNPGGPGHAWVKKMFIDPSEPNVAFDAVDPETGKVMVWPKSSKFAVANDLVGKPMLRRKFIPATLFDNPYLAEDGLYEANLLSLPEHQRRQLLEGDWDISEGSAFPEFNRSIHVVEPYDIPDNWTKFRACDYGYSSYTGVLWFAVDPAYETLVVYRELYVSKVLAEDLADMILEAEYGEKIRYGVLDSSLWHKRGDTGPSIAERMIMKGCRWRPADRSKGSRVSGKNEIHRRLQVDPDTGLPRIVFFNNCKKTIEQLPTIPLDKRNPEDVDTNSEDHLYDTLRYGVMTRPQSGYFDNDNYSSRTGPELADNIFGY